MSLVLVFCGAILAAIANFFFRKNQDHGGSFLAFLTNYYLFSLLASLLITPQIFTTSWSPILSSIGGIAGALNVIMMVCTARALLNGPPGLTFAFQNAGAVFPAFLLFFLFGPTFDFILTTYHLIGIGAVLIGLYLGAQNKNNHFSHFKKWLFFAIATFFAQGIILSMFQWRCLLFIPSSISHPLIPFSCSNDQDVWFIPGFFTAASLLMILLFSFKEKRLFTRKEFFYGSISGIFNGGTTFLLVLATKLAQGGQKAILFPFFAVTVILFCSIWGKALYKEKVNWLAIGLCIFGVFFSLI